LDHSDGGGVWAAENVVEEEVKVAELLFLESQRRWRHGSVESWGFCGGE